MFFIFKDVISIELQNTLVYGGFNKESLTFHQRQFRIYLFTVNLHKYLLYEELHCVFVFFFAFTGLIASSYLCSTDR